MFGKIVSHFEILEELGEGRTGHVHMAQDTKLTRETARSEISPDLTHCWRMESARQVRRSDASPLRTLVPTYG